VILSAHGRSGQFGSHVSFAPSLAIEWSALTAINSIRRQTADPPPGWRIAKTEGQAPVLNQRMINMTGAAPALSINRKPEPPVRASGFGSADHPGSFDNE